MHVFSCRTFIILVLFYSFLIILFYFSSSVSPLGIFSFFINTCLANFLLEFGWMLGSGKCFLSTLPHTWTVHFLIYWWTGIPEPWQIVHVMVLTLLSLCCVAQLLSPFIPSFQPADRITGFWHQFNYHFPQIFFFPFAKLIFILQSFLRKCQQPSDLPRKFCWYYRYCLVSFRLLL